jgi:sterol desaturase/sphingolipid hydroxylase (fatty acid hydroxylase superfamily)
MNALQNPALQLPPFVLEVLRLCIWFVVLLVIFVPLERLGSLHPQKIFRKAIFTDLAYYFLSSLTPKFLLIPATAVLAWALHSLVPNGLHESAAAMPLGARFAAAFFVGEVGSYWGHRWSHEIPFLWRFHAIHHSAEQMDWMVNTRAHPVDLVFTRLCGFVPMYILGLALPAANTLDVVPLLVILTGTVWGFFIHANLRWRLGPLGWLISTPAFHHWHHTYQAPLNKNYAAMLPVLDRVFGTHHMPEAQWPRSYGTETVVGSSIAEQLLDPLLPGYHAGVPAEPDRADTGVR